MKKVASDGTETYFIYDGASVIMEVDTDGDAQATYTYGASGLISQKLGATSYYVGCDHLGSVWDVVTLDTNENVDVSYTHTAFGNTTRTLRQGAADPNDAYRYVGALGYYADADDNHGLLLLGARYYRPPIGRFITLDPIRDGGSWYAYVNNSPTVGVDPTGLIAKWLCLLLCAPLLPGGGSYLSCVSWCTGADDLNKCRKEADKRIENRKKCKNPKSEADCFKYCSNKSLCGDCCSKAHPDDPDKESDCQIKCANRPI